MKRIEKQYIAKARASVPPTARYVSHSVEGGRLRVTYRYPGTIRDNMVEIPL